MSSSLGYVRRLPAICAASLVLVMSGCARDRDPSAVVEHARELIAAGKPGEAHVQLKKLLAKQSDVTAARVLLARIALDNGDARAADNELAAVQTEQLQDPEALATRCWADLGLGQYKKVLGVLDSTTVSIAPSERARLRSTALRASGAAADALPMLRDALVVEPDDGALVVELAATLAAMGNLQQAQIELDQFLTRHPRNPDALQVRGELRLRSGATANAVEDLRAALAAAPASWPSLKRLSTELLLADAALVNADLAQAKERAASLQKRYPGAFGTQLLAARIALLDGRPGEAVDTLQRISEALPTEPRVQALLIEGLLRSGNRARATALLEQRVRQNPADSRARQLLAQILMQQSRPDRVVELLGETPESFTLAEADDENLLSAARLAQERAGEAIATLETKLAQAPNDEQTRIDLAAAYLQNGQPTRGLTIISEVRDVSQSPAAAAVKLALHLALTNDRDVNQLVGSLIESPRTRTETLIAAADAAQRAGRNDVLARLIDRAVELEPKNGEALIRRANVDFLERRYDQAAAALETLSKLDPQDLRPRIALARIAEARGDTDAARAMLRQATKANPQSQEPALMLAGLELRAGRTQAAVSALDAMIAAAPRDGAAANAAGSVLLRARHAEEARARFGQAVQESPANAQYWFDLGRAQLVAEDWTAAAQSFQQAATLRPEWVDANVAAIRLALQLKQAQNAGQMARAFAERLPKEPRAWLLLGDAQMAAGQSAEGVTTYAKAYAMQPSASAAIREHFARIANGSSRADQPLLTWLAREPNDLAARRRLADFYQRSGATQSATEQFETIVRLAPNDVASLNNLAWLLAETDTARAERFARRAVAIVPQQSAIADTLGWVLIKSGKYSEAAQILKRAASDMPQNRAVRYRYALASARAGDKDTARRELEGVLADGVGFEGRDAAQQLIRELGS